MHPLKTKLEQLGDDKGLDSRKKALIKKRYFEQLGGSSDKKKPVRVVKDFQLVTSKKQIKIIKIDQALPVNVIQHQTVPVKVQPAPQTIPKVWPQPVKPAPSVHLSALQEYLREQHGMNVSKASINRRALPFIAFDSKGRPALYGDPILHQKMGLPDAYRVVTGPTGFVHKSYDPSKVQPKFFKSHDTAVVQQY